SADLVEVWGNKKIVHVLLEGDTATLLKSGYDKESGTKIFTPMPRERIELIKSEIQRQKDKLKDPADIWQKIAQYAAIIIWAMCLV
ncbi:MAG: hypothetical protein GTO02_02290, partial [Candidatus Dadabacteria bacterium]|nr:hypothetical protein [Candidatus Dadabacteria bacterium]